MEINYIRIVTSTIAFIMFILSICREEKRTLFLTIGWILLIVNWTIFK